MLNSWTFVLIKAQQNQKAQTNASVWEPVHIVMTTIEIVNLWACFCWQNYKRLE